MARMMTRLQLQDALDAVPFDPETSPLQAMTNDELIGMRETMNPKWRHEARTIRHIDAMIASRKGDTEMTGVEVAIKAGERGEVIPVEYAGTDATEGKEVGILAAKQLIATTGAEEVHVMARTAGQVGWNIMRTVHADTLRHRETGHGSFAMTEQTWFAAFDRYGTPETLINQMQPGSASMFFDDTIRFISRAESTAERDYWTRLQKVANDRIEAMHVADEAALIAAEQPDAVAERLAIMAAYTQD